MAVITITREFGAGAASVAEILARRLDAEVVDKYLVAEVARRAQLPASDVEAEVEHARGPFDRLIRSFATLGFDVAWQPPYPGPLYDPRQAILTLTEEVIREVARRGNAVIVGRGGAFVLADRPGTLRVFLCAPREIRVARIAERLVVSHEQAQRLVHETDANRAAYMRQVYAADWRDPVHYDLILNTGRFSVEQAAGLILAAVHEPATEPA